MGKSEPYLVGWASLDALGTLGSLLAMLGPSWVRVKLRAVTSVKEGVKSSRNLVSGLDIRLLKEAGVSSLPALCKV